MEPCILGVAAIAILYCKRHSRSAYRCGAQPYREPYTYSTNPLVAGAQIIPVSDYDVVIYAPVIVSE